MSTERCVNSYSNLTDPVLLHTFDFVGDARTLARTYCVNRHWNQAWNSNRAFGIFLRAIRNNPQEDEFFESRGVPKTVKELKSLLQLYHNIKNLQMNCVKTITVDFPAEGPLYPKRITAFSTTKEYLLLGDSAGEITAVPRKGGDNITVAPFFEDARVTRIAADDTQNIFVLYAQSTKEHKHHYAVCSLEDFTVKYTFELDDWKQCTGFVIYKQYIFFSTLQGLHCFDYKINKHRHIFEGYSSFKICLKESDLYLYDGYTIRKFNLDLLIEFFNGSSDVLPEPQSIGMENPNSKIFRNIGRIGFRSLENVSDGYYKSCVYDDSWKNLKTQDLTCDNSEGPILVPPFTLSLRTEKRKVSFKRELDGCQFVTRQLIIENNEVGSEMLQYDGNDNVFMIDSGKPVTRWVPNPDKRIINPLSKEFMEYTIYQYQFGERQSGHAVQKPDKGDEKGNGAGSNSKPTAKPNVIMKVLNAVGSLFS